MTVFETYLSTVELAKKIELSVKAMECFYKIVFIFLKIICRCEKQKRHARVNAWTCHVNGKFIIEQDKTEFSLSGTALSSFAVIQGFLQKIFEVCLLILWHAMTGLRVLWGCQTMSPKLHQSHITCTCYRKFWDHRDHRPRCYCILPFLYHLYSSLNFSH